MIIRAIMPKRKKEQAAPPAHKLPPPTNPDGVKSAYTNNAVVSVSQIDARIAFYETLVEPGAQYSVVKRAEVVMSIPHLQAMAQAILKQLATLKAQLDTAKKDRTQVQ
jgi:hypothetical protein